MCGFNDELHEVYFALNTFRVIKSRRMRWVQRVPRMGERRGEYGLLVGKPERKRLLVTQRLGWEDISVNVQGVGWACGLDWPG